MDELRETGRSEQVMNLTALADAYGMLALLTQFPTEEAQTALVDGSLAEDMLAILFEAGILGDDALIAEFALVLEKAEGQAAEGDALPIMRREYTRLFNHPEAPALCIFEELFLHVRKRRLIDPSYVREHDREPRAFVNNASFDAERIYKKAGVVRTTNVSAPSDSMFVEMQFVQILLTRMAKAKLEGDDTLYEESFEHLSEFKHLHLDKWMRAFYEDCASESPLAYFSLIGAFGVLAYDLIEKLVP